MEDENLPLQIIDDVKSVLNQLPAVTHGFHAIPQMSYNSFGSGQEGFEALRTAFNGLDLTAALNSSNLTAKIKKQQNELIGLEKKHTNLTAIIGETSGNSEGSLAHSLLVNIQKQIDDLIFRRDGLIEEIVAKEDHSDKILKAHKAKVLSQETEFKAKSSKLEADYNTKKNNLDTYLEAKKGDINQEIKDALSISNSEILTAENNAKRKVKLINQFSDFLAETNSNMELYSHVIYGLLIAAIIAIGFSIPKLLDTFDSYDTFITSQGIFVSTWHIINYALGILIVKLPWALCLSAVLTGMYKLLKSLLVTYEKINQDKRNMSAIYAISGDVAQSLNEYGIAIAEVVIDEENATSETKITVSIKALDQKRENLRWNQIMNYFERMQQNKEEVALPDADPTKLKLVTDLLNKVIEKVPTAK